MEKSDKSYTSFKADVVSVIDHPSNHSVTVQLGPEKHSVKVCAHGNNMSSMKQLVIDNVCETII